MLKKIFWWFIVLFILFILAVFHAPKIAEWISEMIWVPNVPQKIESFKVWFDEMVTRVPTQQELEDTYNKTVSWALDIKNTVIDWVHTTKDTIDNVRETLSWAEQKVEELKDTYNKTVEIIDQAGQKVNEVKQVIEDTNQVIENVQNIWNTQP